MQLIRPVQYVNFLKLTDWTFPPPKIKVVEPPYIYLCIRQDLSMVETFIPLKPVPLLYVVRTFVRSVKSPD